MAFCISGDLSDGFLYMWRFVIWLLVYVAFCHMAFSLMAFLIVAFLQEYRKTQWILSKLKKQIGHFSNKRDIFQTKFCHQSYFLAYLIIIHQKNIQISSTDRFPFFNFNPNGPHGNQLIAELCTINSPYI